MNKPLKTHTFNLNDDSNGGESILLTTSFYDANEGKYPDVLEIFTNQELTLHSYANSASFNFTDSVLTPDKLRQLANELERVQNSITLEDIRNGSGKTTRNS